MQKRSVHAALILAVLLAPAALAPAHATPAVSAMTTGDADAAKGRVSGSVKITAKCNAANGNCTVGASVGINF